MTSSYLSHARNVQLAIIHSDSMNTSRTVPGHIVMRVFKTKRVLKFIRFSAPILRELASVKSLLCSNITLHIKYSLRNIGSASSRSTGTFFDVIVSPSAWIVVQVNLKFPGMGCIAQTKSSTHICTRRRHDMAIRQSSTQLSMANNWNKQNKHKWRIVGRTKSILWHLWDVAWTP